CPCTAEVRGSNPLISTNQERRNPPACTCRWGGDYSEGETPVPIPNTAVKPFSPDDTWGATPRENRTLPLHQPAQAGFFMSYFYVYFNRMDSRSCTVLK